MPLTDYQRRRIVSLHNLSEGKMTKTAIQKKLEAEGIYTTRQTVANTIARFQATGLVEDRHRSGRPRSVTEDMYRFIDEAMAEDDELTARKLLSKMIDKFGPLDISERTVARARQELGWTYSTTRYCQAIRIANMEKRMVWSREMLERGELFENVIFTDESTIALERHRKKSYRKKGQPRKMKAVPKHPLKVHVWGGISKRGSTDIVIFTGILTATRYAELLDAALIPFIDTQYCRGHRLYQDNDPKHTSRYIQGYFEEKGIHWFKSPAESPDLNPIEKVWGSMKTWLRNEWKPTSLEHLKEGIKKYWAGLTPDVCSRYIQHLQKVLPEVLKCDGGPTGH